MRFSKVILAGFAALVLAVSTMAVANAFISGSSGQLTLLSSPPASVAPGALESATSAFAFNEAQGATLAAPLAVDITDPGTYTSFPVGKTKIPAGTIVDSHLVHSDVPKGGHVTRTRSGTLTFPDDVLGLVVGAKSLAASDFLGAPGTVYAGNVKNRGLDNSQDQVTISPDHRTVSFTVYTEGAMDELRIVTVHTNLVTTQITDSPDPVQAGSNVTYTLHVTNGEPYTISNLQVADTFPGASLVSASSSGGCSGASTVTCGLGSVGAGDSADATVTVQAPSTVPAGGTMTNSAQSPPGQSPTATESTTVVSPVLDTAISDSPDPVTTGNDVQYTLTVTNNGIAPVSEAHVVDTLPPGTTVVSTTAADGCSGSGPIDCAVGGLGVGDSASAEIVVASPGGVAAGDSTTITDSAVASPGTNTTATEVTTVQGPVAGEAQGFVPPGETITIPGPNPADVTLPPTGDGAPIIVTQGPGTFCDGPCNGDTTTISQFDGYNDPNHPISLVLTFNFPDSPSSLTDAAVAYNSSIFKNTDPSHPSDGTVVPFCTTLGAGIAVPHPCVDARTITQPTANSFTVTFTILYLSGDPSFGRH